MVSFVVVYLNAILNRVPDFKAIFRKCVHNDGRTEANGLCYLAGIDNILYIKIELLATNQWKQRNLVHQFVNFILTTGHNFDKTYIHTKWLSK